jgi:serine/threonine-protein kinase RsbW
MKELKIPAKLEYLDTVNAFFEDNMINEGFTSKDMASIYVVIEEIFVNIASYSYAPYEGDVQIELNLRKDPLEVEFKFKDTGKQYNPLEKQDPDVLLDIMDRQIGGLGIFLVKEIMDDVQYEYKDDMNILTLKKCF